MTRDVFVAPHQLRGCKHVRETLGLLEREHAQREATPRGDALALAAQAIVERRSENEEEVGLGLAAPGREPQGVDDSPCAVRRLVDDGREIGEQETELERAPRRVRDGR